MVAQGVEVATAVTVWATTAAILYRRTILDNSRIGGFRRDLPVIQDARFLFDAAFQGARFAHAPHIACTSIGIKKTGILVEPGDLAGLANAIEGEVLFERAGE